MPPVALANSFVATITDALDALALLPPGDTRPLPRRTLLLPRARLSHAVRRELIQSDPAPLIGLQFASPIQSATLVLQHAATPYLPGEDALRPPRLQHLFSGNLPLRYFDQHALRSTPGWPEAFSRTISDLEAAGLRPADLRKHSKDPRLHDLEQIWRALDESAGPSLAPHRILSEAAAALEHTPSLWPHPGPVLALLTETPTAVLSRFLRAIPACEITLLSPRPLPDRYLNRLDHLLGPDACEAVEQPAPSRTAPPTEHTLLSHYLFTPAETLTAPDRPRSSAPDGSVHLEQHSGIESELESTADWLARQILDHRTPLESIAILTPTLDPHAALLFTRLRRLQHDSSPLPLHVAGGLPLTTTATGSRALALIRALRAHLPLTDLADLLPSLRLDPAPDDPRRHLSRSEAIDLASSLGTIGGHPAQPDGALTWSARATARITACEQRLAELDALSPSERAAAWRELRTLSTQLTNLRAIRPALDALTTVARLSLSGSPLPAITAAFHDLITTWLLSPAEDTQAKALLHDALATTPDDDVCSSLQGDDALAFIEDTIAGLRLQVGRFGHPAVYIGTVASAVGLPFKAVRIIGLAEGALPSSPREDPVLPSSYRALLAPGLLPEPADIALAQLHALYHVVRETTGEVVLSTPRTDLNRTQHEPSSVFIEAAAALGRPPASGDAPRALIPDTRALQRDAFLPARQHARQFRLESPVAPSAWLDRAASPQHRGAIPMSWTESPSVDLHHLRDLRTQLGPLDGLLSEPGPFPLLPGITPDRAISASGLTSLLGCPYRFLLQSLLDWEEPATAAVARELDALTYGGLFHTVAERFYVSHGTPFGNHQRSLDHWLDVAEQLATDCFDHAVETYPLAGGAVREQQHRRLLRDLSTFLQHDWDTGPRKFVDVERSFGFDQPVELDIEGSKLFVHGYIDRMDTEGKTTLVRDLKTGRSHPRTGNEEAPSLNLDIQIALYALVTRKLARRWEVPARVAAAYAYVDERGDPERSFRDDMSALETASTEWLHLAGRLLRERNLPRSPNPDDCTWCPFKVVCGDSAQRAAEVLATTPGACADLLTIKLGEVD